MMTVESLNKVLPVQDANVDAMISELVEREEFSGGSGSNCIRDFSCGEFTW